MATEKEYPVFDATDRAVFLIEEAKDRAETMQRVLLPKLNEIVGRACDLIQDVYGIDPFDHSTLSTSPAHRKSAKKTRLFDEASSGLVINANSKYKGYHYFKLTIALSAKSLHTVLQADRPVEASGLFKVLQKHEDEAVELMDHVGCDLWSAKGLRRGIENRVFIRDTQIPAQEQWWHTGLVGDFQDYPVDQDEQVWTTIYQFVGIFAIYIAVQQHFAGLEDRFSEYCKLFNDWIDPSEKVPLEDDSIRLPDIDGSTDVTPRVESTILRTVRDTAMTRRVKQWHDHRCQVCGIRLETRDGPYAEGAHIRPLGSPHEGPDREDNLLCLCPNHHVLFDRGGFSIADDLSLIGVEGFLSMAPPHRLDTSYLEYHRKFWSIGRDNTSS